MRRIISVFLLLALCSLQVPGVWAKASDSKVIVDRGATQETIEPSSTIKLKFAHDFDVNKVNVGDKIDFVLPEAISDADGTILPAGTKFIGTVVNKKNSKWAFRRAKANLEITQMTLPNGKRYMISSAPEKGELKSSQALNSVKAVGMSVVGAGVCTIGAAVIAIECLSVAGIVLAPYTGAALGVAFGSTTKGLDYKAKAGTPITIKLAQPITIDLYDTH